MPKYIRYPIMAVAMLALLSGLWAGWIRLGLNLPGIQPGLVRTHGPLMVSGFLGTLIALERAVAIQKRWTYVGPLLSSAGAFLLVSGISGWVGPTLLALASLAFVLVMIWIIHKHPALYTYIMAAGSICWLVGNLLWLSGWSVHRVVLWWAGFLILTIAGERLELGRLLRLTRRIELIFLFAASLLAFGLVLILAYHDFGSRVAGAGMFALALWLGKFDLARKTIRQIGLPRFSAVCLLSGYFWLGVGGLLFIAFGGVAAGPVYDAALHTVFLGFVFSMIFGHAPIIFPAVLHLPVHYTPIFYAPLIVLHGSLFIRVVADLVNYPAARMAGGLVNGLALLMFISAIAYQVLKSRLVTRQDRVGQQVLSR